MGISLYPPFVTFAKVTKGGYNDIPMNMWEWEPYFSIDKKLLPKTT